jgi:Zn-finger nucleic acid-binding protein
MDYAKERLDICMDCHGIYFDKGELEDLIKLVEDFMAVQFDEPEIANQPFTEQNFKPICPGCCETMETLQISQIWINHCLNCRGIWLDQGELNSLRGAQLLIRENIDLFLRLGQ